MAEAFVSDEEPSLKSDDCSGSNRVKYLYSYGGIILPRHADRKLRYVGGETRVMAADRNITFADLISKIEGVLGCSVLLKCQLPGEDLDALVTIKSDEELESILEEYGRLSIKLRVFLFPKPPNPCREVVSSSGHMKGLEKHHCPALNPLPRTRFARKAAKASSFRKTAAFNCMSKNPYQGGGLAVHGVHPQLLVQY